MLKLTRKIGQNLFIGLDIVLLFTEIKNDCAVFQVTSKYKKYTLSGKEKDILFLANNITLTINSIFRGGVVISIRAPKTINIWREEAKNKLSNFTIEKSKTSF